METRLQRVEDGSGDESIGYGNNPGKIWMVGAVI